ncbi:Uncharacterized protein APZ42_003624 [Daphnia magna]|uniref:Uncharacterized protein n=1 Tax=Daphnia magna TaxID=35525 RepID=A0A168ELX1_9CRUS|nr:Uncharacterized protein APZ42_003624 [Daphnia magna]
MENAANTLNANLKLWLSNTVKILYISLILNKIR